MAFPFNGIEYKVYSKTFLRKVLVGITYTVDTDTLRDEKLQDRIGSFLKQRFELDLGPVDLDTQLVNLTNDELGVRYLLSKEYSSFIIDTKDYKSFQESVFPYISNLTFFARDVLGVRDFKSCFVRKLNVFSLEKTGDESEGYENTQSIVFSSSFLETPSEDIDDHSSEYEIEKQLSWNSQELSVTTRYKHDQPDIQHIQHLLDIEVVNSPAISQTIERLEEPDVWKQMNQVLFNAFHWCVSDRIIRVME